MCSYREGVNAWRDCAYQHPLAILEQLQKDGYVKVDSGTDYLKVNEETFNMSLLEGRAVPKSALL